MQINVKTNRITQEILVHLLPFREGQKVFFENEKCLSIQGDETENGYKEILEFLVEKTVIHELTVGAGQGINICVINSVKNEETTSMAISEAEEPKTVEETTVEEISKEEEPAEEAKAVEETTAEEISKEEEPAEEAEAAEETPVEETLKVEETHERADSFEKKKKAERATKKKNSIDRGPFDISVFDEFAEGKDQKLFLNALAEEYLSQKSNERIEAFTSGILKAVNSKDKKSLVSATEWDLPIKSNITYHLRKYDVSLKTFVEELVAYIREKYNAANEKPMDIDLSKREEAVSKAEVIPKAEKPQELIAKAIDMQENDFYMKSIDDRVEYIFDKMSKGVSMENDEKENILSMFQHAVKRRNVYDFECIYLDNIVEGASYLELNRAEMLCATITKSFCGEMIKVVDFWKVLQEVILTKNEIAALKK